MEQKVYIIENLDCANCAAKIESKFNALPEVEQATIVFPTRQLRLRAANPDDLIEKLTAIARTVESEVTILPHDHCHSHHHTNCNCDHAHHDHHGECACGHDHHDHHADCDCDHDHPGHHHDHGHGEDGLKTILSGGAFFIGGLILNMAHLELPGLMAFLVAYAILGREIIVAAWKNLRNGHMLDENFLMSIASLGAFFIGEAAEAVGVILFYRVGEFFEERAVERSRSQIMEAVDLRPEVVILENGRTIPAAEAKIGDVLMVRPGDRIPLDGIVLRGESRIDTAPITGESVPVSVRAGDSLTSGCVNISGQLTMQVAHPLSESMVTRILNSVENAAASKPKIDRFITRFARIYTPVVVTLAVLVALVPSILTGDWNYWVYTALSFLVMSCPCALVLSVPLAFFSGIGTGSKRGILFKSGASIEAMNGIKAVVLDKTGTVTRGEFRVQKVAGGLDILKLCASCEQFSTHPIARSIVTAAQERGMDLFKPDSVEELSGKGIRATVDEKTILCGNDRLLRDAGIIFDPIEESGSCVLVAIDGRFVGYLVVGDTLKEGAAAAIGRLKQQGYVTAMLTGDSAQAATAVASETAIDEVHAKLLPHQKLEKLRTIRKAVGPVMFVGDGINDAPVLAGADVGCAMGSGADAAIEAADVVFMTSRVDAIPEALEIARRTQRIAWQNVIFALLIKIMVMLLGLAGFASMWMAVFADSGVAMLCVLNSIRLLYKKK